MKIIGMKPRRDIFEDLRYWFLIDLEYDVPTDSFGEMTLELIREKDNSWSCMTREVKPALSKETWKLLNDELMEFLYGHGWVDYVPKNGYQLISKLRPEYPKIGYRYLTISDYDLLEFDLWVR